MTRALPNPTPETAHFWQGTQAGELRLQRCTACKTSYFPPSPTCPRCACEVVEVFAATGRGRLYSYVISHVAAPGFETPYVIAVVELDEGPRLMSNLVGVATDAAALALDLPLEVVFEPVADAIWLPLFRPSGASR